MERGIETNPNKCVEVIQVAAPTTKKEEIKLNGILTALNRLILKFVQDAFPFYKLLKNEAFFEDGIINSTSIILAFI